MVDAREGAQSGKVKVNSRKSTIPTWGPRLIIGSHIHKDYISYFFFNYEYQMSLTSFKNPGPCTEIALTEQIPILNIYCDILHSFSLTAVLLPPSLRSLPFLLLAARGEGKLSGNPLPLSGNERPSPLCPILRRFRKTALELGRRSSVYPESVTSLNVS